MIRNLIAHHVAVTSTLPVFETWVYPRPPLEERVLQALVPAALYDYLSQRAGFNNEKAIAANRRSIG